MAPHRTYLLSNITCLHREGVYAGFSMLKPNLTFEKKLWDKGYSLVAGLDEVGRGAFAGPVVASAVVFPSINNLQFAISNEDIKIDDSKKLTDRQRRITATWIMENCLTWGIGEVSVAEINRLGMGKATASAFRRSVANTNIRGYLRIEYLLVDAYFIPYIRGLPVGARSRAISIKDNNNRTKMKTGLTQKAIVNGDEKSLSIAAASIIAKVYRDDLMIKKSKNQKHQAYKWEKNKGYGTKKHREAIRKFGATRFHRKQFVQSYLKNE